jgi:hypothetical protein
MAREFQRLAARRDARSVKPALEPAPRSQAAVVALDRQRQSLQTLLRQFRPHPLVVRSAAALVSVLGALAQVALPVRVVFPQVVPEAEPVASLPGPKAAAKSAVCDATALRCSPNSCLSPAEFGEWA